MRISDWSSDVCSSDLSIEKALEALGHSQSFIPQIKSQLTEKEQELERVKAELSQRQSVEEVMQRLIANNQHGTDDPPITSGLDEQAVMKLVQQTLNQNKQSDRKSTRLNSSH